jgi:hypothetical protein
MNSTPEARSRRIPRPVPFMGLPLGLLFFAIGMNRPGIASLRTVDLVLLLATGACLGAGLVAVVLHCARRRGS